MAFFLKKNVKNNITYLSIVNSYYDGSRGHTVHKTFASYGDGSKLVKDGITNDPISFLQSEVQRLNKENNDAKIAEISDVAAFKYLGHFLLKSVLSKLEIDKIIPLFDLTSPYQFKLYDVLSSLIYARCLKPCSKYKTYFDVIPNLDKSYSFSYDQLLEGLSYFGNDYERIVEIFTKMVKEKYSSNTSVTYFDCTNFYFEIDREDEIRKKGPSKEKRNDPLLSMGLLLDSNQIPIGLKLFPGNESEKPKIREVIKQLRENSESTGRIVQVADKGLNCAKNIVEALKNNDGYIFSKSCKQLPQKEKVWLFLDNDYQDITDEQGKVIYKRKECVDYFPYTYIDDEGQAHTINIKEKRVACYNYSLATKQLAEIKRLESKAHELCAAKAKKEEYGECSKYVDFKGKDGSKATCTVNTDKIEADKKICGYNLIVSSEINMTAEEIYKTYHNLWRIEESFRIMKSELDARPVFLRKKETIYGHFLICYLSTLLIRILQKYELNDEDSYQSMFEFMREFKAVNIGNNYINLATKKDFIVKLKNKTGLPLTNAVLSQNQINKIMVYKL